MIASLALMEFGNEPVFGLLAVVMGWHCSSVLGLRSTQVEGMIITYISNSGRYGSSVDMFILFAGSAQILRHP